MRPPELIQTPRAPGWVVLLSSGTKLKPGQVPSTKPHLLSLMLLPPPVRVTCTRAGVSTRCSTGSVLPQAPLLLVSRQMIQPQSQSRFPVAVVQPLVLFGNFCIATCPPRLMASERAMSKDDRSDSVASRTRQLSIIRVNEGVAKPASTAMMPKAIINSMAVNPPARRRRLRDTR